MKATNDKSGRLVLSPENTLDAFRLGIIIARVGKYSIKVVANNQSVESVSIAICDLCDALDS